MGRRSSIDRLPPQIREEADAALKRGATIEEIVELLQGLGADVSRSAVGRYSKRYRDLADRTREITAISKAFASEFGDADDKRATLPIQLLHTLITRVVMKLGAGEEVDISPMDLHFIARAVKDGAGAAKTDVDRIAKIKEEARKEAFAEAQRVVKETGRRAGATEETIAAIYDALGVKLKAG